MILASDRRALSILTLLLSLLPATRLLKFHGARRRSHGLCPQCGYDLRATSDRCPECGTSRGMKRA